jgi:hypothetical protein
MNDDDINSFGQRTVAFQSSYANLVKLAFTTRTILNIMMAEREGRLVNT